MVTIAPMLASPSRRPDLPARETLRGRPILQPVRPLSFAPGGLFYSRGLGNRASLLMANNGPQFHCHLLLACPGHLGGL